MSRLITIRKLALAGLVAVAAMMTSQAQAHGPGYYSGGLRLGGWGGWGSTTTVVPAIHSATSVRGTGLPTTAATGDRRSSSRIGGITTSSPAASAGFRGKATASNLADAGISRS